MVYISRIFKKEITIQIVSHAEENIDSVVQRIKNFVTQRFYDCDTKIIEDKLTIENDKNQAKIQIDYLEHQLKVLQRQKAHFNSKTFDGFIDNDIEIMKKEIQKFKKLL